jgi:hypothetical protein
MKKKMISLATRMQYEDDFDDQALYVNTNKRRRKNEESSEEDEAPAKKEEKKVILSKPSAQVYQPKQ